MFKKWAKTISSVFLSTVLALMFSGGSYLAAAAPEDNHSFTPVSAPLEGISGQGLTGIQVQNLSQTAYAHIQPQLYNQTGGAPIALTGATLNPMAATNYYMPGMSTVPSGNYSLVVNSDQPVASIVRTDWSATGGAAIYNSTSPSTDVTVPVILKNFGSQTSQITVQNTDTANTITDVVLTLNGRGLSTPVVTTSAQTIGPGASKTWSLNDAIWGTLPDTGLDLGQSGFVGSIQAHSSTPLVVQSFIDLTGSIGVSGFSGVPTNSAAQTLYCPLVRANFHADTGISIVNPNSSGVTGTITFTADAASPHSGTYTQAFSIPANSSFIAFQGPGGNSRSAPTNLPGGTQTGGNPVLTNDGFFGVATLSSSGPILATVNDTAFTTGYVVLSQSTYNCATSADAGTIFALPLVRRYHTSAQKLTTGIQVQNISNSQVTVHLDLTNWNGTSQSASNPPDVVIPAYGSGNFWNGNLTGLPTVPPSAGGSGWYGSAILTATGGSIVTVVSDEGYGTTAVDSANYNGIKIQ